MGTAYGLRLDQFCTHLPGECTTGTFQEQRTFSVQEGNAEVTLTWNGGNSAQISGTVRHNSTGNLWDVEYSITGISGISLNGWTADATTAGYGGTLTMGTTEVSLSGKNKVENNVDTSIGFEFFNDGSLFLDGDRCAGHGPPCAPGAIEGRGWILVEDIMSPTNDWLVIAELQPDQVSEPGTMALFGLGLLGLGYARRRRVI